MILTAKGKCNTSRSVADTTFFNSDYLSGYTYRRFFFLKKNYVYLLHYPLYKIFFVNSSLIFLILFFRIWTCQNVDLFTTGL